MSPVRTCPNCGGPLPEEILDGLCPRCVVRVALMAPDEDAPAPSTEKPGGEVTTPDLPAAWRFPMPPFRIDHSLADSPPPEPIIAGYLEDIRSWRSAVLAFIGESRRSSTSPAGELSDCARMALGTFLVTEWSEPMSRWRKYCPYNIGPFPEGALANRPKATLEKVMDILRWRAGLADFLDDVRHGLGNIDLHPGERDAIYRFLRPASHEGICDFCLTEFAPNQHLPHQHGCLLLGHLQAKTLPMHHALAKMVEEAKRGGMETAETPAPQPDMEKQTELPLGWRAQISSRPQTTAEQQPAHSHRRRWWGKWLNFVNLLARGTEAGANTVLSPYSIQSALAMAFAGAAGHTRTEMAQVLHYIGDLHFLILLPDEVNGLAALESRVTPELLATYAHPEEAVVILHLPKFRIEPPAFRLGKVQASLGMGSAFDQPRGSADFDRMAPRKVDDYLFLSEVIHKAFLDLNESGTEAAAATAAESYSSGGSLRNWHEPIQVRVDRPFLFAIQHRPSGACLFLGRVTDPRQSPT